MIVISKEISTTSIELDYKTLLSQRAKNYIDISIPLNPKFIGFGALTSFIQFLITWRRLENCGKLILGDKNNASITEQEIESAVKQYFGFVASVLSWENGIINSNGSDIKHLFRKPNARYVDYLQNGDFANSARGDSVLFPFFDHLAITRGLLPIVYRGNVLQDEKEFENLSNHLIEITTKNNTILRSSFKLLISHINGILYELFDNTNKWGRHSHTGAVLNPNLRGIYSKFYKLEMKNISSYTDSVGLKRYFRKINEGNLVKDEPIKYVTFLEISVFDGGSGLVQKFSGQDLNNLSIKAEYDILLDCLKKHNTSHKEFGDFESRGLGLNRIMSLLHKKSGFLKIRSGRMFLYRDFITYPFYINEDLNDPKYWLFDWENDGTNPSQHTKVEGTLITMLIPIILRKKLT